MPLFTSPFTSSPPPPPSHTNPSPSPDGAFEAPDRQSRAHCWRARDDFFACLERHGIVDGIKDAEAAARACGAEGKGFERECKGSWVTYFKQRRVMEHKKKQTMEQLAAEGARAVPMTEGTGMSLPGGGGGGGGGQGKPPPPPA
ncbi:cytochrome oxidase c subunit VIb-domain-containing protein [Usnea florida]